MPNMVLGEDEKNNYDTFSHSSGPAMDVAVVTPRITEYVTCVTPTEHSTNFQEHIKLQELDFSDCKSPSSVTFRRDGAQNP